VTLSVMQVLHQGGGAGSVTSTLHLSLGLARAGVHVRFVCPPDSEVETLARQGGLEVHPLRLLPRRHRTNGAALAAILKRHPVDLVNSQSSLDRQALAWLRLTRRLESPLVITRRQMPLTFYAENWLVSRVAARMVAVSRAVGEALVRLGTPRHKLSVIYNGLVTERVDIPVSSAAVEEWKARIGWEPSRRIIGIVARPKDQDVVIGALDAVQVPVRLVLAGVDPGSEIGRLAARAPGRHAVVCLPFTPEVRPLYELLELVLLPSRMEGLSQSLLEAMALAKPVAVSAATGNLEVVHDGHNGRLVPPRDPAAWGLAIEQLLADPGTARRLGEAAQATARQEFSMARTIHQTSGLYREILGRST
jgi:glycosyltransferase involved in cell wall biosynthesis